MSSPSSNLRKVKKSPLPRGGRVPFRHPPLYHHGLEEDRGKLTASPCQSTSLDSTTQRRVVEGIRRERGGGAKGKGGGASKAPSDSELLGSMATRLALVERELLAAKSEIIDRNSYISQLEEHLSIMEQSNSSDAPRSGRLQELETKCLSLQTQVYEMEEFLNDYGMVWVGREGRGGGGRKGDVWVPEESVISEIDGHTTSLDFDLIIRNLKELSVLAGEGTANIEKSSTSSGARLKPVERVSLTLFKNGLVMFQGPFRPYSDPTTQRCIADLTDGYFPTELQALYPNGVPFQVTDRRDVEFHPRQYGDIFPGSGHALGGQKGPSKLFPSSPRKRGEHEVTSDLPGPKVSLETFLSHLPASVVREGRVVDIRSGVAETLQGEECTSQVTLVETPVLQEMKSRLDVSEDIRPPTPGHVTTLRITSHTGEQVYILKMKHSDTIGDVRRHLNKLRPHGSACNYHLRSTFPIRSFPDDSATLSQCGLVPSANIYMHGSSNS